MNQIYLEPAALAEMLGRPDVRVVDTRASLADGPGGRDMWAAGHVPGAVHADWIEDWGTTVDGVEGMLPEPEEFAKAMSRLGVGNDTLVVAYDDNSLFTASRLAWALLHHGHQRVAILDGGFPAWRAAQPRGLHGPGRRPPGAARLPPRRPAGDAPGDGRGPRAGRPRRRDAGRLPDGGDLRGLRGADPRRQPAPLPEPDRGGRPLQARRGRRPAGRRQPAWTRTAPRSSTAAAASPRPPCSSPCATAGFSDLALYDGSWSEWSQHADNPIQRHG
ncbi:sulfurtransferase [Nonomuraea ferruginea]